jgi:hypothetical protein
MPDHSGSQNPNRLQDTDPCYPLRDFGNGMSPTSSRGSSGGSAGGAASTRTHEGAEVSAAEVSGEVMAVRGGVIVEDLFADFVSSGSSAEGAVLALTGFRDEVVSGHDQNLENQ